MLLLRLEELEILFEELYSAICDFEGSFQLFEKLDKELEVKYSFNWEYISDSRSKEI